MSSRWLLVQHFLTKAPNFESILYVTYINDVSKLSTSKDGSKFNAIVRIKNRQNAYLKC